jgi:glutamate synthase domain-containing protein 1
MTTLLGISGSLRKASTNTKLIRAAAKVFAPPFWDEIERMDKDDKELFTTLRATYGPGMLNGPFAILVADKTRLMGLNDRIKLRPLLVAE